MVPAEAREPCWGPPYTPSPHPPRPAACRAKTPPKLRDQGNPRSPEGPAGRWAENLRWTREVCVDNAGRGHDPPPNRGPAWADLPLPTCPPLPPPPCEPTRRPRRTPRGAKYNAPPGPARDPPQVGLQDRPAPPASGAHGHGTITDRPREGGPLCDVRTRVSGRVGTDTAPRYTPAPACEVPARGPPRTRPLPG